MTILRSFIPDVRMLVISSQESVFSRFGHGLSYSFYIVLAECDSWFLFHATAFSFVRFESSTLPFAFCALSASFLSLLPELKACAPPWVAPRVSTCERICSSTCVSPTTCWSVQCVLTGCSSTINSIPSNYISASVSPVTGIPMSVGCGLCFLRHWPTAGFTWTWITAVVYLYFRTSL